MAELFPLEAGPAGGVVVPASVTLSGVTPTFRDAGASPTSACQCTAFSTHFDTGRIVDARESFYILKGIPVPGLPIPWFVLAPFSQSTQEMLELRLTICMRI
jgi:hypothetical protein